MEKSAAVCFGDVGSIKDSSKRAGHRRRNDVDFSVVPTLQRYYSPLRYPGGKRRLVNAVIRMLEWNNLGDIQYVEPYAGGASIALALLYEEYASEVYINDLSRPVFALWNLILNDAACLCSRIEKTPVDMVEWKRQRAIFENQEHADIEDLGFATLFLNRTNRSGVIGGGVIGGKAQTGNWKLDARFNKEELIQRIRKIWRHRTRIHLYRSDALDFTNEVVAGLGPEFLCVFRSAIHRERTRPLSKRLRY